MQGSLEMNVNSAPAEVRLNPVNTMYLDVLQRTFDAVKAQPLLQPKYHRWFTGEVPSLRSEDTLERRVATAMAERMIANMKVIGDKAYTSFSSRMSHFPHSMEKSVVPGLIPGHITHGVCRLGQTVDVQKSEIDVVRFFITNGDIEIDPARGSRYLVLKDRSSDKRMFFGVAMKLTRDGYFKCIDQSKFDNGVAFVTDNPAEALFNMLAVSTGKPAEYFENVAKKASEGRQTPRF
jgi:hypothetical protein